MKNDPVTKRSRDLLSTVSTSLNHHRANLGVSKFYGKGDVIFTILFPIPVPSCTNGKYLKNIKYYKICQNVQRHEKRTNDHTSKMIKCQKAGIGFMLAELSRNLNKWSSKLRRKRIWVQNWLFKLEEESASVNALGELRLQDAKNYRKYVKNKYRYV